MLSIRLFGRFSAQRDRQVIGGLEAAKLQELFCYFLIHRNRMHSREALAALLWGDNPTAHAKKYLRQTLWQLQTALDEATALAGSRTLVVEPDWAGLNAGIDLWLDVAVLEWAFGTVEGVAGEHLSEDTAAVVREAVDVYQGDLLEGCYQSWCLYERERLLNAHLALLDKLMAYCEVHGNYEVGVSYGGRILRYDIARERTHQRLMRLHYLDGDRAAALRQYENCVTALRDELGVDPSSRTRALRERIQDDQPLPPPRSVVNAAVAPTADPAALTQLLGHLKRLDATLVSIQSGVHEAIQTTERTLGDSPRPAAMHPQEFRR